MSIPVLRNTMKRRMTRLFTVASWDALTGSMDGMIRSSATIGTVPIGALTMVGTTRITTMVGMIHGFIAAGMVGDGAIPTIIMAGLDGILVIIMAAVEDSLVPTTTRLVRSMEVALLLSMANETMKQPRSSSATAHSAIAGIITRQQT